MTSMSERAAMERSPEDASHEKALGYVDSVLLNLDHAVNVAKKGRKALAASEASSGPERNVDLALADFMKDVEAARKRLVQDTYYAGPDTRLI
ncbi:hypothetical protein [Brachybacterium timonense]|uniref:hypothetical protein n=1 Tax=Brachybacterium timonense TaxID=2050896 RepID=UPI000D0AEE2A|nr:hypothetical protein [Brachybacterium timonense]